MNIRNQNPHRIGFITSLICILLSALPVLQSQAQEEPETITSSLQPMMHFTHITSDDGLAQNNVEAILQDSQGFMWIGTLAGLSKFDGYHFTTYEREMNNPNSLRNNWIRDLYEDRQGMIWIGTEGGGVSRLDPRTNTFTHFMPEPGNPNSIAGDRVFKIFEDSTGNFWFTGPGLTAINHFDPRTNTFTRYPANRNDPASFQGDAVWDIHEDAAGNLWMAASTLLARYTPASDSFEYFRLPTSNERRITTLEPGEGVTLWIGGTTGLYHFDPVTESFEPQPMLNGIEDIQVTPEGLFWLATQTGLYEFDPLTKQILRHAEYDATWDKGLSDNALRDVYVDREGVLWIGSNDAGVNIYDPRRSLFAHYRHNQDDPSSLSLGAINQLTVVNGDRLWAAVGTTLDRIETRTGQITHFSVPEGAGGITAVYEDQSGEVWMGTSSFRLFRLDETQGEFIPFPLESQVTNPAPSKVVIDFQEDAQGVLWIAVNHDGLYGLNADRTAVEFYQTPFAAAASPDAAIPTNAPRSPISDLYRDTAGMIWLTTLNGFHRFDPLSKTYSSFRANPATTGPDSYMESLIEDAEGILWLASRDGLIRYDPTDENVRYYTQADGLPTTYVLGIVPDAAGNLWLSTKRGVSRFSPGSGSFQNYSVLDGLQGTEFANRAFAQTDDGRIWFGGRNGLTVFDPAQITANSYQPSVILTDFRLANQSVIPGAESVLAQPIAATQSVILDYNQRVFSLEFAALSYASPTQIQYRYRLDGFEADWNATTSERRFATYTDLPAGSYTFQVQATNDDGQWSAQEATLGITILPPWWEQTGFRLAAVAATIGAIFAVYRWRVQTIAQRNAYLEQEVLQQTAELRERTDELQAQERHLREARDTAESASRAKSIFLANMSHELRSPLNAILGFAQIIKRNNTLPEGVIKNVEIILQSGEHLLALINQVLSLSKIESGQITLDDQDFDLHHLLDDIESMFVLKAQDKRLLLEFDQPTELPRYVRADAVKLRQVLINLIGNALKFTAIGGVAIRVKHEADGGQALRLRFEVEDTGPGIAADEIQHLFENFVQTLTGRQSQEGTGLGLAISRRYVQLMGGEITVKSAVGQGTTFSFSIACQSAQAAQAVQGSNEQIVIGLEAGQPEYRVLIVDDKWLNRQLLVELLQPLGFVVEEARDGQEAVEMARTFQPHLIWMDLRMPVMDGWEASRQIKALPNGQTITVIALTASAFEEDRESVIAAGCNDFLRKPFRTEEILNLMHQYLGARYQYRTTGKAEPKPTQIESVKPDLLALPAALLTPLLEAAELGDITLLERAIEAIHPQNPALAQILARMVERFEFHGLLTLKTEVTP
jgi:signal transduction histidine kinase/ligand-binding sensor domain-containing protein/ActR/RegA family two-component response regulator